MRTFTYEIHLSVKEMLGNSLLMLSLYEQAVTYAIANVTFAEYTFCKTREM